MNICLFHQDELGRPLNIRDSEKFFEICHRHHKSCGIYDPDFAAIERDKAYGANLFWVSEDGALLKQAYDAYLKKINE